MREVKDSAHNLCAMLVTGGDEMHVVMQGQGSAGVGMMCR